MATTPIPVDFVVTDPADVSVITAPNLTVSFNNTIFSPQPVVGQRILVAFPTPSDLNGLYIVTGTIPGGVVANRIFGVPYTVGTRFVTTFGQIYVVTSNVNGVIGITLYNPNDPTLALLLRLLFGMSRGDVVCCDPCGQQQCDPCGCNPCQKEKKCVVVVKKCKVKKEKKCKPCKIYKEKKIVESCGCNKKRFH